MNITVDPFTGQVQLLPKSKAPATGGGGGGGAMSRPPVTIVTSDPISARQGDLIYNTTTSELKLYVDGSWIVIGAAGGVGSGVDNLLIGDGENLLIGDDEVLLI